MEAVCFTHTCIEVCPAVLCSAWNPAVAAVKGSGFPLKEAIDPEKSSEFKKIAEHGWNLNNLPVLPGSVLQYIGGSITGITTPWMYIGMMFSSFCWCAPVSITRGCLLRKMCERVLQHPVYPPPRPQASRRPQLLLHQLQSLGRAKALVCAQ